MADAHDRAQDRARRRVLTLAGAGLLAAAAAPAPKRSRETEKETPAVEDLMREHGVLRRVLLVYREVAPRLRTRSFDARPLHAAAELFRAFGEDYHERALEEAHIFPVVRRAGGPAADLADVLTAQHQRGREVTDYVLAATQSGAVATAQAAPLARALGQFVLMYENHTAREDTVVFPAWKAALPERQIDELGERFEAIERQRFGHDGFEDAVSRIASIEQAYGLADIRQFTAPPPPRRA